MLPVPFLGRISRMGNRPLLLLLPIAFACGGEPTLALGPADGGASADAGQPAPAGSTAGSRLRLQLVTSPSGDARRLLRMIDTELGVPCMPYLPPNAESAGGAGIQCSPVGHGLLVYLDFECTRPAVETFYGDHTWVRGPKLMKVGRRLDPQPEERRWALEPGKCQMGLGPATSPIYALEELGDPEVVLVQGTLHVDASHPRLTVRSFLGEDGSKVVYDLTDRLANVGCTPQLTAEGPRCAPDLGQPLADEGLLGEGCAQLLVLEYGSVSVAPVRERGDEIYRFELAASAGRTITAHRRDGEGRCVAEEVALGRRTAYLGTPYPAQEWPELQMQVSGPPALSARVAVLPDGTRADLAARVDHERMFEANGEPCGPVWTDSSEDRSLRCLPAPPAQVRDWLVVHGDRACTQRLVAVDEGTTPPRQVTMHLEVTGIDRGNLLSGEVFQVGAAVPEGEVYAKVTGGRCVPTSFPGTDYFRLGARVPGDSFPELKLVTE